MTDFIFDRGQWRPRVTPQEPTELRILSEPQSSEMLVPVRVNIEPIVLNIIVTVNGQPIEVQIEAQAREKDGGTSEATTG